VLDSLFTTLLPFWRLHQEMKLGWVEGGTYGVILVVDFALRSLSALIPSFAQISSSIAAFPQTPFSTVHFFSY
jgi:hypothetical protein